MKKEHSDTALQVFMVPVPKAYRDYIINAQNKTWLIILCAYMILSYLWYMVLRHPWHPGLHDLLLIVAVGVWIYRMITPWHYKISNESIRLPNLNGSGWLWLWTEVRWSKDIIEAVEWNWGGLPGFLIVTREKEELLMVYTLADQDNINTQILPLLENHFLPKRQELWADRLRS